MVRLVRLWLDIGPIGRNMLFDTLFLRTMRQIIKQPGNC
jgi:hypothetical protein